MAHIVIDNGSHSCKAGFCGEEGPRKILPTVIGRPRHFSSAPGMGPKDAFVGDEAQSKRDIVNINYPVKQGVVTNWDDMEKIWHHIFYDELCTNPEESNVLLAEVLGNPKADREKAIQVMFETFYVPGFYLGVQAVLSLYSSGVMTGVVLDSGEGLSRAVVVVEGQCATNSASLLELAGGAVTDYLAKALKQSGHSFDAPAGYDQARHIKEKLCYVALDCEQELGNSDAKRNYELPDGNTITVGSERFMAPELLFNPSLASKSGAGIHQITVDSIMKVDPEYRPDIFQNVIVSGASTMFPGFVERMQKELKAAAPSVSKINIIGKPERNNAVWVGGSILASTSSFSAQWCTKEEYDDSGPSIVHRSQC